LSDIYCFVLAKIEKCDVITTAKITHIKRTQTNKYKLVAQDIPH